MPRAPKPPQAPSLSTDFRRGLVLQLSHTQPWGKALWRKLKQLDLDDFVEEPHPEAMALLDAVALTPAVLSTVTLLCGVELDDVNAVISHWDGESDPFPLTTLDELRLLPNLEELRWAWGMPDPPLDAAPLLALPHLRHVELWESASVWTGKRVAQRTNQKAFAALEAAGFQRVPSPEGTPVVLVRGKP